MYVCVYIYVRIDQLDRPGPWTEVVLLEERASSVLFHGKGGTFGGGGTCTVCGRWGATFRFNLAPFHPCYLSCKTCVLSISILILQQL